MWTTSQGQNSLDTYGFGTLPAGGYYNKQFIAIGYQAMFWSTTEYTQTRPYFRGLEDQNPSFSNSALDKSERFSIRCIQD